MLRIDLTVLLARVTEASKKDTILFDEWYNNPPTTVGQLAQAIREAAANSR